MLYTGSTSASGIDKPIPGYTLADAMVRYEMTKNITLSLNVTNLLPRPPSVSSQDWSGNSVSSVSS
ncbi:TonB-dependent receptor domain-containing protein [Brucella pituitosa]|uniref:TonB-dependent receptor domain-containing protein n=1 Tax=Brucella pituitosa TaxID=571256 RepID=UPI0013E2A81B|nr:TonB-dependent receptor [Brucella pituitosa]